MIISTYRNQVALFFLLFAIQAQCFAPWRWPFTSHKQIKNSTIEHVVFDLGGVLLKTNTRKAASTIGYSKFMLYMFTTFKNPKNIFPKLYDTLDLVLPLDPDGPQALSPDGSRPLSQIMRNWLMGTMTCSECSQRTINFIKQNPHAFSNSIEQRIIQAAATMTFSPDALAHIQEPVLQGIEFVQRCKKRGLHVYILSNFDTESFERIKQAHPELFSLFDEKDIFISGKMGLMKPDPAIYELLLSQAGIDADTCVFFDDQQENVLAARDCGINAFQCRASHGQPDYASLEKQLDTLIQTKEQLAHHRTAVPA